MVRNLNVDGAKTLKFPLDITSLRFTDILPDGKHLNKLTDAEIERESTPSKPERNHPDNNIKSDKSDVRFLELNCSGCGNNYIFKHPREIPGVNLNCGLCDRILIHYTGHEDWEYEFYDK
jgi:ribosomal protein S27E